MTPSLAPAPVEIDAVITWVNGADPAHHEKLQAYLRETNRPAAGPADPTRFGDCGEINYCVASLFRFAPWLRTIHIVTDDQTPALMELLRGSPYAARLRVVDHREIFIGLEQHLPTFSSLAIETMLWRIPGLAERFIYFNDDVFLCRPVQPEDFFQGESVVLRGSWREVARRESGQRLKALVARLRPRRAKPPRPPRVSNHAAQQRTADMLGFDEEFFQVPHCPHPMRRSVLAQYFDRQPRKLEENVRWRLRDAQQFLLVGLANHLEFSRGAAIVDNRLQTLRLKPASHGRLSVWPQLALLRLRPHTAFVCVQSLDMAEASVRKLVVRWLDRHIGSLRRLLG